MPRQDSLSSQIQDVLKLARIESLRTEVNIVEALFVSSPEERAQKTRLFPYGLRRMRAIAIGNGCYDADDYLRYHCAA
jgi:hypothetical protein